MKWWQIQQSNAVLQHRNSYQKDEMVSRSSYLHNGDTCTYRQGKRLLMKLEQLERLRSEIPPTAPWLPTVVIHIRSKQHKVKVTNFKKNAKIYNFEILQETLHATHLLKLLYKMHKYEMVPTRTVEATERTRDAGRTRGGRGTDGRGDGRTDGRTEWD